MIPFLLPDEAQEHGILFFYEGVEQCLTDESLFADWLIRVANAEGRKVAQIQVIFLSDDALLEMNRSYLDHDYYTDIITFPLKEDPIEAELYISIDRVRDNADELGTGPEEELARVMVHGILHLCGYGDKNAAEKNAMREMESRYLELLERDME